MPGVRAMFGGGLLDVRRTLILVRVASRFGLDWALRTISPSYSTAKLGVRLRRALETLGLTYVKLGQFLAMRFDVLPPEVCSELSNLFENVETVPFEQIVGVVEAELGEPISELFARFDPQPIAAASVAQVHEAQTHTGVRAAVKVQRPGVRPIFEADMRILRRFARIVDLVGVSGIDSMRQTVKEFETWTRQEFDFILEGTNAERLRARATRFEVIPAVHWQLTTKRVLTMDFVDGVSAARIAALRRSSNQHELAHELGPGYDTNLAMHRLAEASLKHIFIDGLFHADTHPGNVFLLTDNQVALLDFGITGELAPARREMLTAYYEALAGGQIDLCLRYYIQLWLVTPESDVQGFLEEMKPIFWGYYRNATDPNASVESAHWGRVTSETMRVARRHRVRTSMELLLFFRAVGAIHTAFIVLGADFFAELQSFFVQRARERTRRQLRDALQPASLEAGIRDRLETEVRLATVLSQAYNGSVLGLARARLRGAGHTARALVLALMAVSVGAALDGASRDSVLYPLTLGAGGLVLAAMVARLLVNRRILI